MEACLSLAARLETGFLSPRDREGTTDSVGPMGSSMLLGQRLGKARASPSSRQADQVGGHLGLAAASDYACLARLAPFP